MAYLLLAVATVIALFGIAKVMDHIAKRTETM
jgi:hypothetical protein